ncbi:hypothetical protein LJR074_002166 [Acidovorax sp. LjRoot74]|uniref:hypothetical protein n=1 Tax=Acidovorax sp. LjRoot74 TaxID=3342337 RepID=UPI003ED173F3
MTKPASIMLVKRHPLDGFSEFERSIIRRFHFECFTGLDAQHEGRWRRMWARFWNAAPGQVFQLDNVVERSSEFHKRHMAIEQRLFDSQDCFANLPALRAWLKVGAAFVTWEHDGKGGLVAVPRSTSYEKCSDDEMRELHDGMLAHLRTPGAQSQLWPHLAPAARATMLESLLADREKGGQA